MQIITAGSLNTAALGADDFYLQIVQPPSIVQGVPTDVIGLVGTASWGPVGIPQHLGAGTDAVRTYGPVSAAALADPYDLATDLALAFGQATSAATLEAWSVRVSDGTDVAASIPLTGSASPAGESFTVAGTITAGEVITLTATSAQIPGSPIHVAYTVVSGDNLASIAQGLAAAVNNNGALSAAGVTSVSSAAVATAYTPTGTTVTWTSSTADGSTVTVTAAAGGTTTAGMTATAMWTGVLGNAIKITINTGLRPNTFSVVVSPPPSIGGVPESYPNLPAATFWRSLANALQFGLSNYRGPSQLLKPMAVVPAVGEPSTGTFTLTGGTDGRAGVNTADLVGNDTLTPRTGIFALRNLNPAVGIAWLVGCTDQEAVPTLVDFTTSEGVSTLFPMPAGTDTDTAVAVVQTVGVLDPSLAYVKDWIFWFDSANNMQRFSPPTAIIGGRIATLGPQESPGNKPVALVIGTERNNPQSGNVPYTPSEIAQLEAAGIMLITNPIPAGAQFGIRHGQTTSGNDATSPFEWWRMDCYIGRTLQQIGGKYVAQLQSQQANDPLRQAVKHEIDAAMSLLAGANQIDDWLTTCSFSTSSTASAGLGINTPDSVAAHYLFVLVQVRYLSSVRFFVLSLQGGTTVDVQSGSNTASLASAA